MHMHHKILIVDDNRTNIALLEDILGGDYVLETTTSGEEGLAMALEFQPELILLDIMMPGIDGYETCRRMRKTPLLCHTKIIMVSARAMAEERLRGYEAGADDYVTKPFDTEELLAKVRVYLRLKSIEEVDALKSSVLTLLNHRTRTPLSTIITPIQLLMTEENQDTERRQMLLQTVYHSAVRMQRLFDRVCTLSKMKSREWNFEFVSVDLHDLVCRAVSIVAPQGVERHVHIAQELPDQAIIRLDLDQMLGVITTLLDNAIRFSPSPGRVVVRVRRDGERWCLTVSDQGVGITPEHLPYVFDEFVATDLMHSAEGLGLSLAIAHQVVLAHNGTIEVVSTPDVETIFTVRLPIAMPTASEGVSPASYLQAASECRIERVP